MEDIWRLELGARVLDGPGVSFRVWAPGREDVSVRIVSPAGSLHIALHRDAVGYFSGHGEGVTAGDRYFYVLDGSEQYPDPASRFQPEGVHGPSQVIAPGEFRWNDAQWKGICLGESIIYELHVGLFTPDGTFDAIVPLLDYLTALGVTAIELMPVAQFPGDRNWGYDGVYPFAVQNSYGGPAGLKRLIDACHGKGLAVILDAVYNHLGPEGNYLGQYGPYFTDRYRTPWGDAINFDGPHSDEVRRFFIDNALYWIDEFHIDALRLDAVHGIFDFSASPFLAELGEAVHRHAERLGRKIAVIAESDLNDARVISPPEIGGLGIDAQWSDDFHHALHSLITAETAGYYADFGQMRHLEKAYREGFVYTGQYSGYRKRRHGNSPTGRTAEQFIVFSQSHDQVGNRMAGDRPAVTQSVEKLKLAAGAVILSPFVPLLFMGEEYGETAPFCYFTSHSDPGLAEAVREGRRREFSAFAWSGDIPDPQDEETFLASKLNPALAGRGTGKVLLDFYAELMRLRKGLPALRSPSMEDMNTHCLEDERALFVSMCRHDEQCFCLYNFGGGVLEFNAGILPAVWGKVMESSSEKWGGGGERSPELLTPADGAARLVLAPHSFVLYRISTGGG